MHRNSFSKKDSIQQRLRHSYEPTLQTMEGETRCDATPDSSDTRPVVLSSSKAPCGHFLTPTGRPIPESWRKTEASCCFETPSGSAVKESAVTQTCDSPAERKAFAEVPHMKKPPPPKCLLDSGFQAEPDPDNGNAPSRSRSIAKNIDHPDNVKLGDLPTHDFAFYEWDYRETSPNESDSKRGRRQRKRKKTLRRRFLPSRLKERRSKSSTAQPKTSLDRERHSPLIQPTAFRKTMDSVSGFRAPLSMRENQDYTPAESLPIEFIPTESLLPPEALESQRSLPVHQYGNPGLPTTLHETDRNMSRETLQSGLSQLDKSDLRWLSSSASLTLPSVASGATKPVSADFRPDSKDSAADRRAEGFSGEDMRSSVTDAKSPSLLRQKQHSLKLTKLCDPCRSSACENPGLFRLRDEGSRTNNRTLSPSFSAKLSSGFVRRDTQVRPRKGSTLPSGDFRLKSSAAVQQDASSETESSVEQRKYIEQLMVPCIYKSQLSRELALATAKQPRKETDPSPVVACCPAAFGSYKEDFFALFPDSLPDNPKRHRHALKLTHSLPDSCLPQRSIMLKNQYSECSDGGIKKSAKERVARLFPSHSTPRPQAQDTQTPSLCSPAATSADSLVPSSGPATLPLKPESLIDHSVVAGSSNAVSTDSKPRGEGSKGKSNAATTSKKDKTATTIDRKCWHMHPKGMAHDNGGGTSASTVPNDSSHTVELNDEDVPTLERRQHCQTSPENTQSSAGPCYIVASPHQHGSKKHPIRNLWGKLTTKIRH